MHQSNTVLSNKQRNTIPCDASHPAGMSTTILTKTTQNQNHKYHNEERPNSMLIERKIDNIINEERNYMKEMITSQPIPSWLDCLGWEHLGLSSPACEVSTVLAAIHYFLFCESTR